MDNNLSLELIFSLLYDLRSSKGPVDFKIWAEGARVSLEFLTAQDVSCPASTESLLLRDTALEDSLRIMQAVKDFPLAAEPLRRLAEDLAGKHLRAKRLREQREKLLKEEQALRLELSGQLAALGVRSHTMVTRSSSSGDEEDSSRGRESPLETDQLGDDNENLAVAGPQRSSRNGGLRRVDDGDISRHPHLAHPREGNGTACTGNLSSQLTSSKLNSAGSGKLHPTWPVDASTTEPQQQQDNEDSPREEQEEEDEQQEAAATLLRELGEERDYSSSRRYHRKSKTPSRVFATPVREGGDSLDGVRVHIGDAAADNESPEQGQVTNQESYLFEEGQDGPLALAPPVGIPLKQVKLEYQDCQSSEGCYEEQERGEEEEGFLAVLGLPAANTPSFVPQMSPTPSAEVFKEGTDLRLEYVREFASKPACHREESVARDVEQERQERARTRRVLATIRRREKRKRLGKLCGCCTGSPDEGKKRRSNVGTNEDKQATDIIPFSPWPALDFQPHASPQTNGIGKGHQEPEGAGPDASSNNPDKGASGRYSHLFAFGTARGSDSTPATQHQREGESAGGKLVESLSVQRSPMPCRVRGEKHRPRDVARVAGGVCFHPDEKALRDAQLNALLALVRVEHGLPQKTELHTNEGGELMKKGEGFRMWEVKEGGWACKSTIRRRLGKQPLQMSDVLEVALRSLPGLALKGEGGAEWIVEERKLYNGSKLRFVRRDLIAAERSLVLVSEPVEPLQENVFDGKCSPGPAVPLLGLE